MDLDRMLEVLRALVECESPSSDVASLERCAAAVAEAVTSVLGSAPQTIRAGGKPHVRWGAPGGVLLLGHFDTVWPLGTLAERPFQVDGGVARGPGIFDMKAGIVQGLFAVASVGRRDGIEILLNSDEEVGSGTSVGLIEEAARRAKAVLVLEPSHEGALKVARKGHAGFEITVTGRAAHAGLEPEKGANALVEMASVVGRLVALQSPSEGTTVTPSVASAGVAANVVPPEATLVVDIRTWTAAEHRRVAEAVQGLAAEVPGTRLEVRDLGSRGPLEKRASESLFERALALAGERGLGPLEGTAVGGGSDGNFTAALGVPTLDGLGAVGGGAHAVDEHVVVDQMAPRAALVAALVEDVLRST